MEMCIRDRIMEILRQRGVRLIAINDSVDSARGDDDFTPFRNIMHEYYARDTSRKIRSSFQSKGKSGKHLTGTVIYGYLWNEARDPVSYTHLSVPYKEQGIG